jgi:AraC-like DNA-binding protein
MSHPPTHLLPEIHHVGRVLPQVSRADGHWAMAEHAHAGFHELIYVVHGAIETRIQGHILTGLRGDILLYPQGESHSERAVGEGALETIFIGWTGSLPSPLRDFPVPLQLHDRAGRIAMLVEWIAECTTPLSALQTAQANILLAALLFEYARLAQSAGQARVQKAREYIRRHLSEPIDLDQLAGEVGLSKFHFCREFKRLTGQSPMAALRGERVAAARSLLLSTPWKLQLIAQQVGFADEYQLSRVFKRVTGISPGKVRD